MKPTIEEIEKMVALQLGKRGVKAEQRLFEDLDVESVDLVNIVVSIEERYEITIDEVDLRGIMTVRDLFVRALERYAQEWEK